MHTVKESKCPYCLKSLDMTSQIGEGNAVPIKGDATICIYCGNYLAYGEELKLEKFTTDTWEALGEQAQNEVRRAQKIITGKNNGHKRKA